MGVPTPPGPFRLKAGRDYQYRRPDPVKIWRDETQANLQGFSFRMCRVSDPEYRMLHACALPLQSLGPTGVIPTRPRGLTLGHVYFTLLELTGNSSEVRDTYKSAFSFPFLFAIERASRIHDFLVVLSSYRSSVETTFYKLVLPDDPELARKAELRSPNDEELSAKDMEKIEGYFWGLVGGYTSARSRKTISPFARCVKSNLVIFGFENNEFFEEQFHDEHAFNERMTELEARGA